MTVLLRWTIRIHKWLALAVGIQIVLWVMGGVVMSVIPIERVRGEHNIAPTVDQPLRLDGLISPDAAVLASGPGDDIRSVTLGTWLDRPVYDVVRLDGAREYGHRGLYGGYGHRPTGGRLPYVGWICLP